MQGFLDLDSERSHGMGITSIPTTSILEYCKAFDFDEELIEDFTHLIRTMDNHHTSKLRKKEKSKNGKNS